MMAQTIAKCTVPSALSLTILTYLFIPYLSGIHPSSGNVDTSLLNSPPFCGSHTHVHRGSRRQHCNIYASSKSPVTPINLTLGNFEPAEREEKHEMN